VNDPIATFVVLVFLSHHLVFMLLCNLALSYAKNFKIIYVLLIKCQNMGCYASLIFTKYAVSVWATWSASKRIGIVQQVLQY
jgi:hypothetical protein